MKIIFSGIIGHAQALIKQTNETRIGKYDKEVYTKYLLTLTYQPESSVHAFVGNKWNLIEHEHWSAKESDVMFYLESTIADDQNRVEYNTKKANLTNEEYAALYLDENGNTLDDSEVSL